jgi:hypothetical protein
MPANVVNLKKIGARQNEAMELLVSLGAQSAQTAALQKMAKSLDQNYVALVNCIVADALSQQDRTEICFWLKGYIAAVAK